MIIETIGKFLVALSFWVLLWMLIEWGLNVLQSKIERNRR